MAVNTTRVYTEADQLADPIGRRAPLVLGGRDFHGVTEAVAIPL